MSTTLSATDVQLIANNLLQALTTAAGKGGSSIGPQKSGGNLTKSSNSVKQAEVTLSKRVLGLAKTVDTVTESSKKLAKIQEAAVRFHGNATSRVAAYSKSVAGLLADVQEQAVNLETTSKISKALQEETKKAISTTSEFGKIIAGRQLENATDFKNVSTILHQVTSGLEQSRKTITRYDSEITKLEQDLISAQSGDMSNLSTYFQNVGKVHDELKTSAEGLNQALLRQGVVTQETSNSIKDMSAEELKSFVQRIRTENLITDTTSSLNLRIAEQNSQMRELNKGLHKSATTIHTVDKGFKALAKSTLEQVALGKMGVSPDEISNMQRDGLNIFGMIGKTFIATAFKGIVTVTKAAWNETKEIAKAAFETGTKPFESTALSMRMAASDLQRATALYKQSAIGGKGGIAETHQVLGEFQRGFHQLTGDPKTAAELNLRTQNFTKSYLGGSQTVKKGTAQWETHLKSMSVLTGKSGDDIIGMIEGQMESAEMQEVMLSLSGKEQALMVSTLQARQKEFASMGLTAEKATDLAAAMAKVKEMTVPDRIKQAGKLAQTAMRLGMNPQDAMKLRMMHASGDTENPEYLRITKQLGTMYKSGKERARASSLQGNLADEHLLQQLVIGLGSAAEILKGTAMAAEVKDSKGVTEAKLQQTVADTYNDSTVKIGEAALIFSQTVDAMKRNVIGVMQHPLDAVAQMLKATTGVGTSVAGESGNILGSNGVLAGGALLGAYGLSKIPKVSKGIGGIGGKFGGKIGGKLGGKAIASLLGKGVGGLAGSLLGPIGAFAVGAAGGLAAEKLFDVLLGTDKSTSTGNQSLSNAATPATRTHNIQTNADSFMEAQALQNAQLIKLNEQMKTVGDLILTGNTSAVKTSDATTKLMEAYYAIEMEKNATNKAVQTKLIGSYLGQFGSKNGMFKT